MIKIQKRIRNSIKTPNLPYRWAGNSAITWYASQSALLLQSKKCLQFLSQLECKSDARLVCILMRNTFLNAIINSLKKKLRCFSRNNLTFPVRVDPRLLYNRFKIFSFFLGKRWELFKNLYRYTFQVKKFTVFNIKNYLAKSPKY